MLQVALALRADQDVQQLRGRLIIVTIRVSRGKPKRSSGAASLRQCGSTFTQVSRYTFWPSSASRRGGRVSADLLDGAALLRR